MKHKYSTLLCGLFLAAGTLTSSATQWSYDWPISATKDKDTGYANGFYNFSSSYDGDRTEMTRTFNEKQWTVNFDAGAQLAYTSSGQSIGSAGKGTTYFNLWSDAFDGTITSATIELKTQATDATISFSAGGVKYLCDASETVSVTGDNALHTYEFIPAGDAASGIVSFRFESPAANTANYVKKITITYEERQPGLGMPLFSPAPGVYDAPVDVALTAAEGAIIRYTLDGSSPIAEGNASAVVYTEPFTISQTTTIQCVAQLGGEISAIAEGRYNIRSQAGLSLLKTDFEIELLEDGLIVVDNPNNVGPLKFSSSNPEVAYCDRAGYIYTYSLGEAVISVKFDGDDDYLPQTLTANVTVVAKDPVTGFTVSPEAGEYDGPLTVTVKCTDPRVDAIWYNIGNAPSGVDELGMLEYGEYTICPESELTLTLDEDCVLSVQAVGYNLWSEPIYKEYKINMPLKADFEAVADNYNVVYHQGWDSAEEANTWDYSSDSEFSLEATGVLEGLPPFSVIDPKSKYSLYHDYDDYNPRTCIAASPVVHIPENAKLRFYMVFNPVWLAFGNIEIYACEEGEEAVPQRLWNALKVANEAATDDVKWNQYYVDLDDYAGRDIYFAIAYNTEGDVMLVDNFEVVVPGEVSDVVKVVAGDSVSFANLSTGHPDSYLWTLPGSDILTSDQEAPSAVYNVPGVYDVTLTVARGNETDTKVRTAYIEVSGSAPTAVIGRPESAYYSPEAGMVVPVGTPVTFTDQSKGAPESWLWTLPGTDLKSAVSKDVTVSYETEGMYDVDLTVTNSYGTSSTYIYGVKAGGESLVWNIPTEMNSDLGVIMLGWYGIYGGSNWLDMPGFAERFDAPMAPASISGVNIYFAGVEAEDQDAEIKVSLMLPGADGLPASTLATTSLTVSELVDASETYNDPTWFGFDEEVAVNSPFFVAVEGFPNSGYYDAVAMYSIMRADGKNTAYHLLDELDDNYVPTGEQKWYAQEDEAVSFAIAPKLTFTNSTVGTGAIGAVETNDVEIFSLQGIKLKDRNLERGIYIERTKGEARKVRR